MTSVVQQPSSPPFFPEVAFDVVAIATSAGGLRALSQILPDLPANFPAPIVIVQHLDPHSPSLLPGILSRCTSLRVKVAENGEHIQAGTVYVAPPDWHLLLNSDGTLALAHTARVHFTRPAADVLFESIAACCQTRAIAVVLTGSGRDGALGIQAIKQNGGATIVQDAETAEFPGMPKAAIETHAVDWVLPLHQIAPTLVKLVSSNGANV